MARDPIRVACEHESAHAVVAFELGAHVARIVVHPHGGGSVTRLRVTPTENAVISCAGDLWDREYSTAEYRDGACTDLAYQVQQVGAAGIWQARRTARQILTERRRDVLDLAGQLYLERELVFQ
jgi:hypothetical protein